MKMGDFQNRGKPVRFSAFFDMAKKAWAQNHIFCHLTAENRLWKWAQFSSAKTRTKWHCVHPNVTNCENGLNFRALKQGANDAAVIRTWTHNDIWVDCRAASESLLRLPTPLSWSMRTLPPHTPQLILLPCPSQTRFAWCCNIDIGFFWLLASSEGCGEDQLRGVGREQLEARASSRSSPKLEQSSRSSPKL